MTKEEAMGQKQINPIVAVALVIAVVAGVAFFGFKAMQPAQPAPGSYTPGVPPWLDKSSASYGKGPAYVSAQRH